MLPNVLYYNTTLCFLGGDPTKMYHKGYCREQGDNLIRWMRVHQDVPPAIR